MNNALRLPSVPSLSTILPAGTESGKEFGRIVGLLLLNEAKRLGLIFSLYDDASGDFEGLDSYSRKPKEKEVVGYQYKYFPSPLSDNHRHEIVSALDNAVQRGKRLKLQKWVLVTPDDFTNASRRQGGGDVDWFEQLRKKYNRKFEVEHVGHSKLISLFMQASYLCLFYYPSLVADGFGKRKTIQELRALYDEHMKGRYGRIEFVGMSVYKDETSRRVPLENIYIPLSILPEQSPEENDDTPRVDPTALLAPGLKSVILGDPGSGKSTLLAFLALVGGSDALQARCGRSEDRRLTFIVTLRRYADELKENPNLPLLDHILNVARADFNIPSLDASFYEFYLESGQGIVLFDGLDELPGTRFKSIIKNRIESFTTTYQNNTVIITSRLVGYEAEVRFDNSYRHYRVAKLRPQEIEKFILDWYAARIEDVAESKRNSSDLIRVIAHTESESIRDLARNPLLLTIVTLVHRIDAVLPDQRVILYQKCTETLLNTWYKAKRREDEAVKGRVERRNRLRIEAIAYWMQKSSIGGQERSVVPHDKLLAFLTDYIIRMERPKETDEPAEDQAEVFLDFIKNAAGLLIEAGDGLYSFIHLTFQEYLCATHLSAFGEMKGAQSIWNELDGNLQHPRWREVVRLLVASLKSIEGQTFFIDKLVSDNDASPDRDVVLLLIGLLKDALEPAEERAIDIVRQAICCLVSCAEPNDVRSLSDALRAWVDKQVVNRQLASDVYDGLFKSANEGEKFLLALIRSGIELPQLSDRQKATFDKAEEGYALSLLKAAVFDPPGRGVDPELSEALFSVHMSWAGKSRDTNLAAVGLLALSLLVDPTNPAKRLHTAELGLLIRRPHGPHHDHGLNLVALALPAVKELHPTVYKALQNGVMPGPERDRSRYEATTDAFHAAYVLRLDAGKLSEPHELERFERVRRVWDQRAAAFKIPRRRIEESPTPIDRSERSEISLIRTAFAQKYTSAPGSYWQMYRASEGFSRHFATGVIGCAKLNSPGHWIEALRFTLGTNVPSAFARHLEMEEWARLRAEVERGTATEEDLDAVAWLLLFDIWIWNNHGYEKPEDSPVAQLALLAEGLNYAPIVIALAARAVSHGIEHAAEQLTLLVKERGTAIADTLRAAGWAEDLPVDARSGKKLPVAPRPRKVRGKKA